MTITMTTDGAAILRERAAEWPLFAAADLPDEIGVLTVQVERPGSERPDSAVARVSRLLEVGLIGSASVVRYDLWLLALGSTVPRARRRGVLLATRAGLWGGLEIGGIAVPAGPRSEMEIDYPEISALGFAGGVRFGPDELAVGIEVTRTRNAVCVGIESGSDPMATFFASSLQLVDGKPPTVLSRAVGLVADGTCTLAARGFVGFDHLSAGVDVFAHVDLLDELEAVLREVISARHV
jgi:hypothetical protein